MIHFKQLSRNPLSPLKRDRNPHQISPTQNYSSENEQNPILSIRKIQNSTKILIKKRLVTQFLKICNIFEKISRKLHLNAHDDIFENSLISRELFIQFFDSKETRTLSIPNAL
jgi:hypothetical protein